MKRQHLQETNRVEIDLSTNRTVFMPYVESKEALKTAANLLTNKLLDYVNSGGYTKNLTPDKIFGKKERL